MTQQELAQRVGCSVSLIFKIESDERRPSRQIAELLAEHLEIPPEQRALFLKVARQEKTVGHLDPVLPHASPESSPAFNLIKTNLPLPLTTFIGREHELQMVIQQVQDPACRLLTLTGLGGVGKTRLALEVSYRLREAFKDGVCFVSLVGTSASEFIIPAIAEALDFSFSGPLELKAQLFNFLKEKQMLMVLDNLEHLLSGIELLDEFLEHVPNVKLLTTSREQLNLRTEWAFEVQGLPVPSHVETQNLGSNSAAMLFVQRAKQAKMDFILAEDDHSFVQRICQLVEGLPLGLELAAAWVRVMSVEDIALEMERNIDFLATTARDVPPRHRSIRAVFEHSWSLLTEKERRMLRQLTVFRGGFTRAAAQQVAGASISQLSALVDKSLLRHTRLHIGWYDFHELIRQYVYHEAQENLQERAQFHEQHASYYAALLHEWESLLQGPQQQEILDQISLEIDNIRSAWDWMITHHRTTYLQQSLVSLFVLHDILNWLHQGAALFEQAVAALQPHVMVSRKDDVNKTLLGELMACQGHLCWHLGQTQRARDLLQQSLQLLGSNRDRPMLAEAVLYLSVLEHSQGNYPAARQLAEQCVALNRQQGRVFGLGYALSNLGLVCLTQGEPETAYTYLKESIRVMQSIAHPRGTATNLTRLGLAALRLGKFAEAQECLNESLETSRRLHDRWGIGNTLNYLGLLARKRGDFQQAEALIRESISLFQEDGDQILLASTLTDLGYILLDQNAKTEARQSFLKALQVAHRSGAVPAALSALPGIATLYAQEGDIERALELATHSWNHPSSSWQTRDRAQQLQAELKARLKPQQWEAVQARVQAKSFETLVQEVMAS